MGFIVRMYDTHSEQLVLAGRAPSATDALALVRRWRTDRPATWVSIEPRALPNQPEAA